MQALRTGSTRDLKRRSEQYRYTHTKGVYSWEDCPALARRLRTAKIAGGRQEKKDSLAGGFLAGRCARNYTQR